MRWPSLYYFTNRATDNTYLHTFDVLSTRMKCNLWISNVNYVCTVPLRVVRFFIKSKVHNYVHKRIKHPTKDRRSFWHYTLQVYMRSNERSTGSVIIALAFVSEHQAREFYIVIYFRCTQPRFSRTESTTIQMPPVRRADVCFPILAGKLSLSAYIEDDANGWKRARRCAVFALTHCRRMWNDLEEIEDA